MSFLFKNKKPPGPTSTLPPATRNITSAHGERTMIPSANGIPSTRTPTGAVRDLPKVQAQSPTPDSSVNASLSSVTSTSPEPAGIRELSEVDMQAVRASPSPAMVTTRTQPRSPQGDNPYPWSQRRINFTTQQSPFPRYGAAVNSTASKEGWVYVMGGLVNSTTVKGDLWLIEVGTGATQCYPIQTPSEGPGPRVGHASLLVGNAFIVFGGDTKLQDEDVLDDTLYLLNTASKQWSKAQPPGPRPSGRYGHTLNILGSKIYIFGGQVEGFFFNDLVAFDLNGLQAPDNRWQMLIPNSKDGINGAGAVPAPRTNHSCVTWQDKLYLFGGTDGTRWFNDVWTYDPRTNQWSELDCIGYIPAPREGHAAALVDDTMYIFGGRVQDGSDLGDLAAFRISSRRWYMFQNMGMSPSARSGHSMTAYGKNVVVLGGEPSTAPHDPKELSLSYILDTSKIRYPPSEAAAAAATPSPSNATTVVNGTQPLARKFSGEDRQRSGIPVKASGMTSPSGVNYPRVQEVGQVTRPGTAPSLPGPPPTQQPPQPQARMLPFGQEAGKPKKSLQKPIKSPDLNQMNYLRSSMDSSVDEEIITSGRRTASPHRRSMSDPKRPKSPPLRKSTDSRPGSSMSRQGSRNQRQQPSLTSFDHARGGSIDDTRTTSRNTAEILQVDSGIGSSPALSQQNDELMRELEAARSRNAWYASELALARKAGYQANTSSNPALDEKAADTFSEDDRPLIEAMLRMRSEVTKVNEALRVQAVEAANRVAEIERQRDAAISEAMYAKAKLAAHGGDAEGSRDIATPEGERSGDISKRLGVSLASQRELSTKLDRANSDIETEKRARQLAEETAEIAEKRVAELDAYRQRAAGELESLRAELHEAERVAREESANAAEAHSAHKVLEVDKRELTAKYDALHEGSQNHENMLRSLHEAVAASTDKAVLMEEKLTEERRLRGDAEQQLSELRSQHGNHVAELENAQRRLRDAEDLAGRHAAEAKTHREAMLSGLARATSRGPGDEETRDRRVEALQEQVFAANTLVRKNQEAADAASEKLRRAEERIAGLEAYQEQSSREGLTIRKQLQVAMRDSQSTAAEKVELQQHLDRHKLESNALEVQLKTLKELLDERGVSAADRRSRVLDSPSMRERFGTPELNRVKELEQQLDQSLKAHDDLRVNYEQKEAENSRAYDAKLATLESDHQAAVKYVRGIEKMLAKMKQELQRTKGVKDDLEKELSGYRNGTAKKEDAAAWATEKEALRGEMAQMQESLRTTIAEFESQIQSLKASLEKSQEERANLQRSIEEQQTYHQRQLQDHLEQQQTAHQQQLDSLTQSSRTELENAQRENAVLTERAKEAERKVQLFLDQFETSVDNYRRQSRMPAGANNTLANGHQTKSKGLGAPGDDGAYSPDSGSDTEDDDTETAGRLTPSGNIPGGFESSPVKPAAVGGTHHTNGQSTSSLSSASSSSFSQHARDRSSMALDSLASELESLRTQWETTNQNYRLSDRFDFEKGIGGAATAGGAGGVGDSDGLGMGDSLAAWRARLDLDEGRRSEDG